MPAAIFAATRCGPRRIAAVPTRPHPQLPSSVDRADHENAYPENESG